MSEHEHYHHEGDHHHHHHEGGDHHHHESGEHHDHHHHHEGDQQHQHESNGNGNDYVVVPPTPQSSVDAGSNQVSSSSSNADEKLIDFNQEDIQRLLSDIGSNAESKLNNVVETIRAEADSSSSSSSPATSNEPKSKVAETKPASKKEAESSCGSNASFLCPYYLMGKSLIVYFRFFSQSILFCFAWIYISLPFSVCV